MVFWCFYFFESNKRFRFVASQSGHRVRGSELVSTDGVKDRMDELQMLLTVMDRQPLDNGTAFSV